MVRRLVDLALENRFFVLAALFVFVGGRFDSAEFPWKRNPKNGTVPKASRKVHDIRQS
ncbi:MAG: hypothetical protein ABSA57_20855 [Candidatus Acidiferrales bacterium]|jgi:hypothetical protein